MKKILATFWLITLALPAAPKLLPFQGHLMTSSGQVVADGAKVVQFKIYDAPVSGNAVWAGEVHKLSVNQGLVNTILGTKTAFPARYDGNTKVMFSEPLYVEITVDAQVEGAAGHGVITVADPPLLPRQVLLPANFAHVAQRAETVEGYDMVDGDGNLKAERIAAGSISGEALAGRTVPAVKIVGNSIGIDEIGKSGVGTNELVGSVNESGVEIIAGAVTSAKIKDHTTRQNLREVV